MLMNRAWKIVQVHASVSSWLPIFCWELTGWPLNIAGQDPGDLKHFKFEQHRVTGPKQHSCLH